MGYTLYYEGTSEIPLTPEEREALKEHEARWNRRLSSTSEDYSYSVTDRGRDLRGCTKPGRDDAMDEDVETITDAVEELDRRLPNFQFTVTDDYETVHYSSRR